MTELYINGTSIARAQPCLSVRDYQSAIDRYKDIQNANPETHIHFGTDAGGLTTYEYYKSTQNTIHIITRYVGRFISHITAETKWIESMEEYLDH